MENPKKITTIGGQALMEGIMMVGPKRTVAAFCDEEGISTEEISVPRLTKQYPLLGKPFIRGIFALADSFRMGYKALSLSADKLTEGDEEEELTGLDKWLNDHLGEKITGVIMAVASVLGIALAVVLFFMLPTVLFNRWTTPSPPTSPGGAPSSRASSALGCLWAMWPSSPWCRTSSAPSSTTAPNIRPSSATRPTCP